MPHVTVGGFYTFVDTHGRQNPNPLIYNKVIELAWFLHVRVQDIRERTASGTYMYCAKETEEIAGAVGHTVETSFAATRAGLVCIRHSGPSRVPGIDGVEYDFPDSTPIPSVYNVLGDGHVGHRRAV